MYCTSYEFCQNLMSFIGEVQENRNDKCIHCSVNYEIGSWPGFGQVSWLYWCLLFIYSSARRELQLEVWCWYLCICTGDGNCLGMVHYSWSPTTRYRMIYNVVVKMVSHFTICFCYILVAVYQRCKECVKPSLVPPFYSSVCVHNIAQNLNSSTCYECKLGSKKWRRTRLCKTYGAAALVLNRTFSRYKLWIPANASYAST